MVQLFNKHFLDFKSTRAVPPFDSPQDADGYVVKIAIQGTVLSVFLRVWSHQRPVKLG
jgi:hypothetical protein